MIEGHEHRSRNICSLSKSCKSNCQSCLCKMVCREGPPRYSTSCTPTLFQESGLQLHRKRLTEFYAEYKTRCFKMVLSDRTLTRCVLSRHRPERQLICGCGFQNLWIVLHTWNLKHKMIFEIKKKRMQRKGG